MTHDELRGRLVGAWRVTDYEDRPSVDAEWGQTYGADLDGLIIYDPSGWLSVNVAGDGRFDSYFGSFEVLEASERGDDVVGFVNHEIVRTSMPELLTADQGRPFRVHRDTLVLGDEETWRRVCVRIAGARGA